MEISLINVNVPHKRATSVFPGELAAKNLPANAVDTGSMPGLGRSPGRGHGNPFLYFCLENIMDRGAWWAAVLRAAQSQT